MSNDPTHLKWTSISRRSVLKGISVAAAAPVVGFPWVARAQASTMTLPNPGGALEDAIKAAYFQTFQAKSGVQVIGAPYMDTARVKAMVDNNAVDVDLLMIDAAEAATLAREGLLEPIDYDILDKTALLPQAAKEYYVLAEVAAYVMAWNTQAFDAQTRPKDWKEFFDVAGKSGQRGLWKYPGQTLEVAAMGGGQSRDKLYPLNLDAAFRALGAVKDNLTWWTSGAQSAQLLIAGEIDVGTVWNGRLYQAKLDGQPVDYTFDNALYVSDAMVIPKGSKNKKRAMEFLANMYEAQNQAEFCRRIPYGPVNTKAFDLLDEKARALLPNSPKNGKTAVFQDFDYWAQSGQPIVDRFNNWLLG